MPHMAKFLSQLHRCSSTYFSMNTCVIESQTLSTVFSYMTFFPLKRSRIDQCAWQIAFSEWMRQLLNFCHCCSLHSPSFFFFICQGVGEWVRTWLKDFYGCRTIINNTCSYNKQYMYDLTSSWFYFYFLHTNIILWLPKFHEFVGQ